VWTGSANVTDAGWTRQENNIIQLASTELAGGYRADFDQLGRSGQITGSGSGDTGTAQLGTTTAGWAFAPGGADHRRGLGRAGQRRPRPDRRGVHGADLAHHPRCAGRGAGPGAPLSGVYDTGQMTPIVPQRRKSATGKPTAALFDRIAAHLVAKKSAPYTPHGVHDFMHHKLLVCDDTVATGSFKLSHNAAGNAENSPTPHCGDLARRYTTSITELIRTYSAQQ